MKKLFIIIVLFLVVSGAVYAAETASPPKRIISLAPSMTEILYALGLGDNIAGVTTYCDYPEEAKKKPKIGGMSNPSLEAVVSLKPDIVVMTTDGNPKEFQERLASLKINTYVFQARRLMELPRGIRELGRALNVQVKADTLAQDMETGISNFKKTNSARSLPSNDSIGGTPHSAFRKKVLFIVWPEPLIVAGPGTAMDDAINMLGYENIASRAKSTYPKYSIEELIRQAPDILFIGRAMGMDMRALSEGLLKKLGMVPAVKNGSVHYVSDNLYRLGPRVIKGIEELAGYLPPLP